MQAPGRSGAGRARKAKQAYTPEEGADAREPSAATASKRKAAKGADGAKRQGQRRGSAGQITEQPQLHSDTI